MSYIDIIFLVPIAWGAYKGFKKGLIIEVFSLLALILGIFCAIYFPEFAQQLIETNFQMEAQWVPILAFVSTFIAVVILVNIVGGLLTKVVDVLALGFFNKLGGLAFGVFKTMLILCFVVLILNGINNKWNFIPENQKQNSVLFYPMLNVASMVLPLITSADWTKDYLPSDETAAAPFEEIEI